MTTTNTVGLSVIYGESLTVDRWKDDGSLAYRICIESINKVLPMPFQRQADADIAMDAIAGFTDWTVDEPGINEALRNRGSELRRRMTENLAW